MSLCRSSHTGYFARGLNLLTSDASVTLFLSLVQSFGNSGLTVVYSPWYSVDHFGRVKIREALDPSGADKNAVQDSNVPESTSPLKPFAVPKPNKRRSHLFKKKHCIPSFKISKK